jgi:hypothetical protein
MPETPECPVPRSQPPGLVRWCLSAELMDGGPGDGTRRGGLAPVNCTARGRMRPRTRGDCTSRGNEQSSGTLCRQALLHKSFRLSWAVNEAAVLPGIRHSYGNQKGPWFESQGREYFEAQGSPMATPSTVCRIIWLACTFPCRRFADILADACARLGADVVRYSFIVVDLHHLLLAGLPAHLCENAVPQQQSAIPLLG